MDDKTKRAIAEMENVSASSRIDDEHEALVRRVVALLEAPGCPDDVGLLAHDLVDKALQLGRAEAKREIDNERAYRSIAEGALDKAAARVAELEVSASAWREFRRLVHNTMEDCQEIVGGADISACYNVDEGRFEIGGDFGETGLCAYGPSLELAMMAAGMLDEGQHGAVDAQGRWICDECGKVLGSDGGGCEECPMYLDHPRVILGSGDQEEGLGHAEGLYLDFSGRRDPVTIRASFVIERHGVRAVAEDVQGSDLVGQSDTAEVVLLGRRTGLIWKNKSGLVSHREVVAQAVRGAERLNHERSHRAIVESEVRQLHEDLDAANARIAELERAASKPLDSMSIIHVPGWVEDGQARSMCSERFEVKPGEPLELAAVGLTVELTGYPSIRITQEHDPRVGVAAVERVQALEHEFACSEAMPSAVEPDARGAYMVLVQYDNGADRPPLIRFFVDPGEAMVFFEKAGWQWSQCVLARLEVGCNLGNGQDSRAFIERHRVAYEAAVVADLERRSKRDDGYEGICPTCDSRGGCPVCCPVPTRKKSPAPEGCEACPGCPDCLEEVR